MRTPLVIWIGRGRARAAVAVLLALVTAACDRPAAARAPGPSAGAAARPSLPPALPLHDGNWARLSVNALSLSLELPDASAWQSAGGRDWVRLEYRNGESSVALRRFRAEATVRPLDCASRAGFSWESAGDDLIERRRFDGRNGLRTELTLSVAAREPDGTLIGRLESASAGLRVCVALRAETRVRGEGREAELARRLALFGERVVPSLELVGIEDRIRSPSEPEPDAS